MHLKQLLFSLLLLLGCTSQAFALGGSFGARVGTGVAFDDNFTGDDLNPQPFAAGLGYKLDLVLLEVEADALYHRTTTDYFTMSQLSFPIIGKFSFPVIPALLSLSAGAGINPRVNLSTSDDDTTDSDVPGKVTDLDLESTTMYLPFMIGAQINLAIITLNIEIRYEHQLSRLIKDSDAKINDLMFMGGVFF